MVGAKFRLVVGYLLLVFLQPSSVTPLSSRSRSSNSLPMGSRSPTQNINEVTNLLKKLLHKSDSKTRPDVNGPPVKIECDFYVASLGSINANDMDYTLGIHFRQRWKDPRLTFEGISNHSEAVIIPQQDHGALWIPDLYFPNEKHAAFHSITVPNMSIKIYPNGTVVHSSRLTLRLGCPMYLAHFPMDYQVCHFKISSYSYETNSLQLDWVGDDAIEIYPEQLQLPHFELQKTSVARCTEHLKTGDYDCLQASFHLRRQYGFYVLQAYIPCILIVILSWVSFWINKDSVPARITLGVTTVLAMATALTSALGSSMSVSYAKALDVWYAFCMILVFGALLEFALVNVLARCEVGKHNTLPARLQHDVDGSLREIVCLNDRAETQLSHGDPTVERDGSRNRIHQSSPGIQCMVCSVLAKCLQLEKGQLTADGLDKLSRVFFPLSFSIFNVVYWMVYTQPVVYQEGVPIVPASG